METKGNTLMQKYETGKLLGQGTFAKVYHGRHFKTGQSVAIKVIDKDKIQKCGLMRQTKREISVMRLVRHPNVIQLHEVMATKTKIYLVMEYAKGGELFHKLAKGRLKEAVARKYFQQLIRAINFCHNRGVYHRDLKPENLLLDENGILKVSDFGLSALAESGREDGLLHTTCGTPSYVAPEVISRKGYDGAKADVWSCGVILFVLLAGKLPFNDSNLIELYRKIRHADYKCPNVFSREAHRLLSKMLDPDPCSRISIAEIMGNCWFGKGLVSNLAKSEVKNMDEAEAALNIDTAFDSSENSTGSIAEGKLEVAKPTNLNAFDIISLSTGLDLSGLFVRDDQRDEVQFTSMRPASAIISRLEDIASNLKLKVNKDGGLIELEEHNASRYGSLSISIQLFEITSSFHLVELRKSRGDTIEYQKLLREDIRPALKEVVWAWQGEQQQNEQEQ